jgi:hypothetical protein
MVGDNLVAKNLREKCVNEVVRVAIRGAKAVGHWKMLINEQTLPSIMGKMLATNWKKWTINSYNWVKRKVEVHSDSL